MTFHMTNRDGKGIVHENYTTVSHLDKVSTRGILRSCSTGRALLVCEYAFVSKKTERDISSNKQQWNACFLR
jgi:hypothetical protein